MSLKQLLRDHRDDILARFVRDVRGQERAPPPVPQSVLIDHIPAFLEEIVEELVHEESLPEPEALAASGRRHGEQRWRLGEDIEAVVREYGTLRHAIYEEARAANVPMSLREFETLARCLNLGIAGATAEYVRLRDSQSEAQHADLELIGEAGEVLGSSIDYPSTLSQLFGLLLPRLADFCVVQLDGRPADHLPIAHVQHGQIELLRELVRRFEPDGLPGRAEVSKLGKAVLLEWSTGFELEQFARAPEHRAYLEQLAARSFLVAPLRIHARTIGTLTIGSSESERRYKASDMLLVGEVARRAASAIDNARLYELSRSERVRAEAATRAKDEFVAVVSHELRTPLNVIIGWTRLLRSGSLSDKTREHALEVVERNAAAQNQLVADLLDISRVLTGKVRLDPAQLDLGSLLRLVLEDARLALEAKRLRLHVDIGDATLMRGDADRLKQVVWNLLLNAIKFTQKG
ncbi:MAG TPA: histidine kinase dimerization/phospho-acceptor domain-containing protein, partial [Polyangiales bacterium]|nr:histidine kinase dimerization/phospho-acceptor domain-containing protein [Polyangiales bacterium]